MCEWLAEAPVCFGSHCSLADERWTIFEHGQPAVLDTLAAAYAEAGRFSEAVATVSKALELLTPQREALAKDLRGRLELYEAGKPYREQPQRERLETGRE